MKTIGLDTRMIRNTGIGTYLQGLVDFLDPKILPPDSQLVLYGQARGAKFENRSFEAPIYSPQEQFAYPKKLSACQLWHAPHYNIPFWKGKTKLVVTVHDLIHWVFRKNFLKPHQAAYSKIFFDRVAKTANHIITVSEKTKTDLIEHFRVRPEKVSVIYEAVHPDFHPEPLPGERDALQSRYALPRNYFLYVGMIKPHKNVHMLVRAFREMKKKGRLHTGLVLVGRLDPAYKDFLNELKEPCVDLIHLPHIEKGELPVFYRQAVALAHPSLYEGFGLTLLEAMASGIPVLASQAGSIPEIAGNSAWLLNPHDVSAWQEALKRMETEPLIRNRMKEQGLIHVKKFDWRFMAEQTAEIYKKVLGS